MIDRARSGAHTIGLSVAALVTAWMAPVAAAEVQTRGLVRSLGEATISSEMAARIVRMPFREGQVFAAGEVLVAFDCEGLDASAAGAEADLRAAQAMLLTTREMARLKAAGQRDVDLAEAKRDRASADLDGIRSRLRACTISAPFAGAVVERPANLFEVVAPAAPLVRIVDLDRLEIELIVPSAWLRWLLAGTAVSFRVDETGRSYAARIARLGGAVDPVSQTLKTFATFDEPHPAVVPGMSGTAKLSVPGE